jgi:hypothetical protein
MHQYSRPSLLIIDRFSTALVRSMACRLSIFCRLGACLMMLACWLLMSDRARAEEPLDFAAVAGAVANYFNSLPGHQPKDLVNQSQVAEALDAVAKVGWDVPDRDALVKQALADGSFLTHELATPAGRKFMRNIARYPGAYSRLDRLSTISGGQKLIDDLIEKKGGYELIEYLATTEGGHNLGTMMAGVQHGVDLNKPTGRIYTADDLLAALKAIYDNTAL